MRNREDIGIKKVAVLARRCANLCFFFFFLKYRKGAENLFPYVIYSHIVFLLLTTTVLATVPLVDLCAIKCPEIFLVLCKGIWIQTHNPYEFFTKQ